MTRADIEALIRKTGAYPHGEGFRASWKNDAEKALLGQYKEEIKAYFRAREAERVAAEAARQARIRQNVPGLDEMREGIEHNRRQRAAFERAMETGDGLLPSGTEIDLSAIAAMFPRAAAYLRAEDASMASWDVKSSAGRRAKERLEAGEDHEQVISDMEAEVDAGIDWTN